MIDDYTFFNFPQKKTLKDYETAQKEFVDYYKRIKGVSAIYKIGSVSRPGLSDLDFIVVLDDDYKHRYGVRYDINYFSDNSKYILYHPQFFISKSSMKNIYILYRILNLEKVWGEDIRIERYGMEEFLLYEILNLLDLSILRSPKLILKSILNKNIDVRLILSQLTKDKYAFILLNKIIKIDSLSGYFDKLESFKTSWFSNDEECNLSQLILFMKRAPEITYYLIDKLKDYMESKIEYNMSDKNLSNARAGFRHKDDITYFERLWNPVSSLNRTEEIFLRTRNYVQFLPLNFSFHLFQYAAAANRLGNSINEQLFLKPDLSFVNNGFSAQKRAEYLNKNIEFLENKKIVGGASFCFFRYKHSAKKMRGEYKYSQLSRFIHERFQRKTI